MADLQINTDEITAALKANLEGFTPSVEQTTVGRVLEVGDGIARVSGLPNAAVNEMLRFENGLIGLALNLDEDSIGAVVLGEADRVEEGMTVAASRVYRYLLQSAQSTTFVKNIFRNRRLDGAGVQPGNV